MEVFSGFNREMISLDLKDKTVRFHLFGKRAPFISRSEFLVALKQQKAGEMLAMWKGESPFEIFITFTSDSSATYMVEHVGHFDIGETSVVVSDESNILNDVRIHWTPLHIDDAFFREFLEEKGFRIINSKLDRDMNDGLLNGVRSYRLLGTKDVWDSLPHVVDFKHYGFQALFKVTGREPLCLRCRKLGHQRAQCDQNRASAFVKRQEQQRQLISDSARQSTSNPRRWEQPALTKLGPSRRIDSKENEETKDDSMTLSSDEDEASLVTVPDNIGAEETVLTSEPQDRTLDTQSMDPDIPCGQKLPSEPTIDDSPAPTTQELVLGLEEVNHLSTLFKSQQDSSRRQNGPRVKKQKCSDKL